MADVLGVFLKDFRQPTTEMSPFAPLALPRYCAPHCGVGMVGRLKVGSPQPPEKSTVEKIAEWSLPGIFSRTQMGSYSPELAAQHIPQVEARYSLLTCAAGGPIRVAS